MGSPGRPEKQTWRSCPEDALGAGRACRHPPGIACHAHRACVFTPRLGSAAHPCGCELVRRMRPRREKAPAEQASASTLGRHRPPGRAVSGFDGRKERYRSLKEKKQSGIFLEPSLLSLSHAVSVLCSLKAPVSASPQEPGLSSRLLSLSPTHSMLTLEEAGGTGGALGQGDPQRFQARCGHRLAAYL